MAIWNHYYFIKLYDEIQSWCILICQFPPHSLHYSMIFPLFKQDVDCSMLAFSKKGVHRKIWISTKPVLCCWVSKAPALKDSGHKQ